MSFDPGLAARIADLLPVAGIHGARQKNVFGGRGFLLGKSTFAIAWNEGLLIRTTPDDYPRALAEPGVTPFAPGGDRPMGTWVIVPDEAIADDPQLAEWLARGARALR